jgi:hypothetical protein
LVHGLFKWIRKALTSVTSTINIQAGNAS